MPEAVNPKPLSLVDGGLPRLLQVLWTPRCLVCGERGDLGRDLCRNCAVALPWLRSACPTCALPLPMPASACGACLRRAPPLGAVHAAFV